MLTDIDVTPKKDEHGPPKLRRSYAILDIAAMVSAESESEHEPHISDGEYEPQGGYDEPQNQDDNNIYDNEPTPKKKQKNMKVPIREVVNANRNEHHSHGKEEKVSWIV